MFRHASTSNKGIERAVKALMQGIATDYPHLLEDSQLVRANGRHQHG